jgi:hypothetical protein
MVNQTRSEFDLPFQALHRPPDQRHPFAAQFAPQLAAAPLEMRARPA